MLTQEVLNLNIDRVMQNVDRWTNLELLEATQTFASAYQRVHDISFFVLPTVYERRAMICFIAALHSDQK